MRWSRWCAALLVVAWFALTGTSLAMEGNRARLAPVAPPAEQESDSKFGPDKFYPFHVAGAAGKTNLGLMELLLDNPKRPSAWTVFGLLGRFGLDSLIPLLPDEAEGWAELGVEAGEGILNLIAHYKEAVSQGGKALGSVGAPKSLAHPAVIWGGLRMGFSNIHRVGDFAKALAPSNLAKTFLSLPANGNWATAALRWTGLLGCAFTAVKGGTTLYRAITDRNADGYERFVRGVGGVLTIASAVAGVVVATAAAPAIAAGAIAAGLVLGISGAVLSNEKVARKIGSGLRTAANWVATGARNLGNKAANAARNLSNRAAGAVRSLSSAAVSTARNLRDKAASTASNLGSKAYGTLRNAASQVNNAGQAIKQGLGNLVNRFRGKKEEQQPSTQSGPSHSLAPWGTTALSGSSTRNRTDGAAEHSYSQAAATAAQGRKRNNGG